MKTKVQILFVTALAVLAAVPALAQPVVPESRAQVALSFAPVVRQVAPAVVNVYASRKVEAQVNPLFADPLFRQFFGGRGVPPARMESSLGSGTIIDRTGLIVTNHHVIKDATDVKVALADRREFEADVVLKDERTDLAVIKIREKGDYPVAEIGDSETLQVGDLVLAIGNPFGVGQTVTQGIVSALARTQVGVADYQFFIQTDAAINPGNSGGALVDLQGRLVGVPSAIYSRSGGSIGIGFAIPATIVKFVVEQAKTGNVVRRPWLGATLQNVTADVAETLGLDRPRGALIAGLIPGGPAAKAGLKIGDLLLTIDGHDVDDPDGFGFRFGTRPLGGTAKVTIRRGKATQQIEIAALAAPETVPRDERVIEGASPFAGTTVVNLSPAVAEELRLPFDAEGVVVRDVAPGSPAARVGFQKGDFVVEINGTRIDRTATLARVAQSDPGLWRLVVKRDGQLVRLAFRG
ncbi:DegQ family serine endoprotease [Siculibacillus lacustris]|uniref:DegQ family serine endoprotease n=1 Tax=Siculibacillus lacustris TaxID=1549641 RepID=A0A4Q9VGE9_9HYPH|nr:DegQ family serine endoprotease [Siculibacillus lacustris]TBW34077.1 DegQ family serine endoprotease [Siculibacillus lacustris]